MADAVTDTHGLIWYLENSSRLGSAASQAFDACDRGEAIIYVPAICLVEMIYLEEKGRIPSHLRAHFDTELRAGNTGLLVAELTVEVVDAVAQIPRSIVADMPDRIIAATALHLGLPLISQDRAPARQNSVCKSGHAAADGAPEYTWRYNHKDKHVHRTQIEERVY